MEREWESQVAPAFDQENDDPRADTLGGEEIAHDSFMYERLARFDSDYELKKEDFVDTLSRAEGITHELLTDATPDVLLLQRTAELWAGLRRVYFGEVEDLSDSDDTAPSPKRPRTRENVREFKREIDELRSHIRQEKSVPDDLNVPLFPLAGKKG
jgi:hypothetical protein